MNLMRSGAARVAAAGLAWSAAPLRAAPPLGFKADAGAAELAAEQTFDAAVDAADIRGWLQQLASAPNHVGSPHDQANAEAMLALFRSFGWDAHLETFSVLYPTPKSGRVELVAPTAFKARLAEPPVAGDPVTSLPGALPPYLVGAADGDVTADLVYANFGLPADYEELRRRGLDVAGKIVIVRYGSGFRGIKVRVAQEHGAVGCLIYSDPHEDGYFVGDPYPQGGGRPADGVQRGSVEDLALYAGDPLTPGVGSTPDAKRIPVAEARVLMKIPALPLSSADAQPLLAALGGPVAPAAWRGALPLTYHLGPGPAKVHLALASDWSQVTLYDVIATLKGSTYPDQWVVRGNHHDGWVAGAWDPLSGMTTELAEAKAIGALVRTGWRPKRTLVYCSWDGEEPGLLGSTEWAETHAAELQAKAVLYVNSDTNSRGFLKLAGSASLQRMVNEVAGAITDPEVGGSVLARERARIQAAALDAPPPPAEVKRVRAAERGGDLPLAPLGGGSDYSAFLQHLGIASLDYGYGGEGSVQGVYHSAYDSFEHFERFGDPKFRYEVALAQTAGHTVLRAADADVLPFHFSELAGAVGGYVEETSALLSAERERSQQIQRLAAAGVFRLAADPEAPRAAPAPGGEVPALDFGPLQAAASRLEQSAQAYDLALARAAEGDYRLPAAEVAELNRTLQGVEQTLLLPQGLPGREWYRYALSDPGLYTGYGAKTLPAIREAIEEHQWPVAEQFLPVVAQVLAATAARLDEARKLLQPRLGGAGAAAGARRAGGTTPTPTPPLDY